MKIEPNTLKLVRALVKITSAVTDIDELKDHPQYKYQIKKDLNTWQEWIEEYTKDSLIKLTKAGDTTLGNLIGMYDDFENRFDVDSDYNNRLLLFLAKVSSALRDLENMTPPYNSYVNILSIKLKFVTDNSYLNDRLIKHPKEFNNLLSSMNKLSDEEIIGSD
jgi:hypothetical protein